FRRRDFAYLRDVTDQRSSGLAFFEAERYSHPMLSRSPASHPFGFIEPCLPTPSRTVPDGPRWAFEVTHDGLRFIAQRDGDRRRGDRVRVFSRHGRDWTDRVPAIVKALGALPVTSATIDGEGVVCDDRGVTDFERLRAELAERGGSSLRVPLRLRFARARRRGP